MRCRPSPTVIVHGRYPRRCRRVRRRCAQVVLARYYDPTAGQLLSRDPIASLTQAAYSYASSNPVNDTDPTGLCSVNPFSSKSCLNSAASAVGNAASNVRSFVYRNAGTLSTVASGLATVAYATCAVTAGVGCGVGVALSATSTVLAGVNTYRACIGGQGNCAAAAIGLGISAVATGAGALAQRAAAGALSNVFNPYALDIYLARQAGVIGGVANFIATLGGLVTGFWGTNGFGWASAGCMGYP